MDEGGKTLVYETTRTCVRVPIQNKKRLKNEQRLPWIGHGEGQKQPSHSHKRSSSSSHTGQMLMKTTFASLQLQLRATSPWQKSQWIKKY
jgi:hypothetical protein